MSGDDLRVTAAHLRALSSKQRHAATEIRAATAVTEGVAAAVRSTHGVIASATANAVSAVQAARKTAGNQMAGVSDSLNEKLNGAATRYDQVDGATGGILGQQVQPR